MRRPVDFLDSPPPRASLPLFDFSGPSLTRSDRLRLGDQLRRVADFMGKGGWYSLEEISIATGAPEASVSARLRDLRRPKCGCWTVERRRRSGGLWEYRAVRP